MFAADTTTARHEDLEMRPFGLHRGPRHGEPPGPHIDGRRSWPTTAPDLALRLQPPASFPLRTLCALRAAVGLRLGCSSCQSCFSLTMAIISENPRALACLLPRKRKKKGVGSHGCDSGRSQGLSETCRPSTHAPRMAKSNGGCVGGTVRRRARPIFAHPPGIDGHVTEVPEDGELGQ